jgi:hypothetical protein
MPGYRAFPGGARGVLGMPRSAAAVSTSPLPPSYMASMKLVVLRKVAAARLLITWQSDASCAPLAVTPAVPAAPAGQP